MEQNNAIHTPTAPNLQTELIDLSAPDAQQQLARAAQCLRRGGLVAFPTETVYGLGANALDPDAARRVYAAKGRPADNPLIVHIAKTAQAAQFAYPTPLFEELAARFWPGPLTMIVQKRACIPDSVTGGLSTVGLRLPSEQAARTLILQAGVPVAAPSANLSGKPSPTTARHVIRDLYGRVDMILCGPDAAVGVESTVIRLQEDETLTVLRPGAVTPQMLQQAVGTNRVALDQTVLQQANETLRPQAPGMKYRHYAPRATVTLLRGTPAAQRAALLEKRAQPHTGILCYAEDEALLQGPLTMSLGPRDDVQMQAHRLFACLRAFDDTDAVCIYAPLPQPQGIGLAVYNRLAKAAGFRIVPVQTANTPPS